MVGGWVSVGVVAERASSAVDSSGKGYQHDENPGGFVEEYWVAGGSRWKCKH